VLKNVLSIDRRRIGKGDGGIVEEADNGGEGSPAASVWLCLDPDIDTDVVSKVGARCLRPNRSLDDRLHDGLLSFEEDTLLVELIAPAERLLQNRDHDPLRVFNVVLGLTAATVVAAAYANMVSLLRSAYRPEVDMRDVEEVDADNDDQATLLMLTSLINLALAKVSYKCDKIE
jgi:hypothetical protein